MVPNVAGHVGERQRLRGWGLAREPDQVRGLTEFNDLPDDSATAALTGCCSSQRWVDAVLAGRPYAAAEDLLVASDAAVAALTAADLHDALAAHPRLGEQVNAEQALVMGSAERARRALAEGNAEYERRFGHIYLACATGRSAGDLLAFLRERLGNDPETEWRVVAAELAKINQIRLRKLTGGAA